MKTPKNINVLFVAGFGPIVRDPAATRKFYSEALALHFEEDTNGYLYTGSLDGVKHFALWPLAQAAESCFGTDQWPGELPVPQAWIEFDVEDIEKATAELKSQGYKPLAAMRKEPWGQVVTKAAGARRSAGGHNPYASNEKGLEKMSASSIALQGKKEYGRLLAEVLPSVIHTERQHAACLKTLETLLAHERLLTPAERELVSLLTLLMEDFEEKHYSIPRAAPAEVLELLMIEHGLRQKDLLDVFRSPSIVSEVLSGKRELSKEHIRRLSSRFHLSPEVFF